jgi:hypothetical protein
MVVKGFVMMRIVHLFLAGISTENGGAHMDQVRGCVEMGLGKVRTLVVPQGHTVRKLYQNLSQTKWATARLIGSLICSIQRTV